MARNRETYNLLVTLIGVLVGMLIVANEANAQDQGFIYGRVTTIDGDRYTGQIRWGKEETFWGDQFDAEKLRDKRQWRRHIEEELMDERDNSGSWKDVDWKISSIWEDYYRGSAHQFTIRFGDLKSVEYRGRNRVVITLKDGTEIPLAGEGYNDVGARVQINDFELGEITIKGDRVDRVDFMSTPSKLPNRLGNPLLGTVHTFRSGSFTGIITWDHDENLDFEKLDGKSRDGDVSIPFSNIKSIASEGRGSLVTLTSGRELYLSGTNDVDGRNSGIWVNVDGIGQLDVKWRDFERVEFDHSNADTGPAYEKYVQPKKLYGRVRTVRGDEFQGEMIFDLDEEYDFELLDGNDDNIKFEIPFRNIKRIRPRNYNYSNVELKNGETYLLGDHRDISDDNDGIIILSSGNDPIHVRWREIDEIVFR